jgi:GGDEF domain-containing protein
MDQMRGLNDGVGFEKGDALIHATARLLEGLCAPGVDFVGHLSGSRFVVLMQSEDWRARADRLVARFHEQVREHVPAEIHARGYFTAKSRDGTDRVRPLPRIAVGVLPVLPGVFETRHEVVLAAKHAADLAFEQSGTSVHVDEQHGNAYPQSVLFDPH